MSEGINWLEWSKETFDKAKREDKPILLDIHGVWCHWCHRMEEDTYSNTIVIETINEKFVPIRVDTDKRPDINERYNQGGWPTTAFLSPDGILIAGATYVPPSQLAAMLEQVWNYYKNNKQKIKPEFRPHENEKGAVKSVLDDVAEEMTAGFDAEYGGFGSQPKFPFPDAIELAMLKHRKGEKVFLRIATKTLDGMLGIFDSIAGGFYRYSVTRSWDEPHYEKMLETNAQLIQNYLHAFRLTGNEKYRTVAERTADYLLATLHGPDGFYGSQDADGEEDYYGKPAEEREKMPQPYVDKNIYVSLNAFAISAFLRLGGKYRDIATGTMENLWNKCFDTERGMCHYYDGERNVFGLLADNVNFVRCLLDDYEMTANSTYLGMAQNLMDLTIRHFFDGGFNDRTKNEGDTGMLSVQNKNIRDNAAAAECLVRLAFYSGKQEYRELAEGTLSAFAGSYKNYGIHAAAYAMAAEIFLDPIEITAPASKMTPKAFTTIDPRIMVKPGTENKIYVCRNRNCRRFDSPEEARQFIEAIR